MSHNFSMLGTGCFLLCLGLPAPEAPWSGRGKAGKSAQPGDWPQNSKEAELGMRGLTVLRTVGSETPIGRKDLTRARSAAAIVSCSSVLEGIGLTPSKELCSLQSQVRGGQFSWDNGRAAAVDTGKANFWGLALTRVPACGRARKGPLFSALESGSRQDGFLY